MTLDNNHILLLNSLDEKPHTYDNGKVMVKYQYGSLSLSGNTMSIAFILRVVDEYYLYNTMTNLMIPTTSPSIKEKSKVIIREK